MEIKFEHARALQTNICNAGGYNRSRFGAWLMNSSINKFAAGTRISSGLQKNSNDSDYTSFEETNMPSEAFSGGGVCSTWRGWTLSWEYTTFKDVIINVEQETYGVIIRTVPGGIYYESYYEYHSLGEYSLKVNSLEAIKDYYAYPFIITGSYFYLIILDETNTIWTIDDNHSLFNTNVVYNKGATLKNDLPTEAYKIPIKEEIQLNVDDIVSNIGANAVIFFDAKELKSKLLLHFIPVSLNKLPGRTLHFEFAQTLKYKVV